MKIVEIIRLEESEQGTIGVIRVDKECLGFVLEPPDRLNKKNISSIPTGQYVCKKFTSKYHGHTYQVTDVPGRSAILFHPGNVVTQTAGCILLGSSVGNLRGNRAVLNSGKTFVRFMEKINSADMFHLTIREEY